MGGWSVVSFPSNPPVCLQHNNPLEETYVWGQVFAPCAAPPPPDLWARQGPPAAFLEPQGESRPAERPNLQIAVLQETELTLTWQRDPDGEDALDDLDTPHPFTPAASAAPVAFLCPHPAPAGPLEALLSSDLKQLHLHLLPPQAWAEPLPARCRSSESQEKIHGIGKMAAHRVEATISDRMY
ncbi:hypothetical protein H920_14443 [Fukomys damarensis]|uniref:Uncharacterized protein n=1 Tax=Fukomys damarensis TaxID=885580 RepID=A0A091DN03_FUKDA|nr:hypothetical protein H920_14443 [Fukomys damarensis]